MATTTNVARRWSSQIVPTINSQYANVLNNSGDRRLMDIYIFHA
uniref:Uncharacterized protein n=1 Tax=Arundo donax TaxID=35708 RepID=A0A0A9F1R6_ARUDO